jgi:hypothetical protein
MLLQRLDIIGIFLILMYSLYKKQGKEGDMGRTMRKRQAIQGFSKNKEELYGLERYSLRF